MKTRRRTRAEVAQHTEATQHVAALPYLASPPAETAIQSIIDDHKEGWRQAEDGKFVFGDPRRSLVMMGDPQSSSTPDQQVATWQKLLEMDESAAQSLFLIMGKDLSRAPGTIDTRITVNELLSYKGFARERNGDYSPALKRAEQRRLLNLAEIWVSVNDEVQVRSGKGFRSKKIKLTSRLIDLGIEEERKPGPKNDRVTDLEMELPLSGTHTVPYAFRVSLGKWSQPYRAAPNHMRAVLTRLGRYDTQRETERVALRIIFVLLFANHERRSRWAIREILELARLSLPKHHADRFRKYFEEALDMLTDDGLIRSWEYAPESQEENLPGKRWLEKWIEWELIIDPRMIALRSTDEPPLQKALSTA